MYAYLQKTNINYYYKLWGFVVHANAFAFIFWTLVFLVMNMCYGSTTADSNDKSVSLSNWEYKLFIERKY